MENFVAPESWGPIKTIEEEEFRDGNEWEDTVEYVEKHYHPSHLDDSHFF